MRRKAVSLVEAVLAVAVVSIAGIPLLTLMFQQSSMTTRGHLHYIGMLAAREEIGDIRFRLAAGTPPAETAHDWKPLTGQAFARLASVMAGDPGIKYTDMQSRLETKVTYGADAGTIKVGKIAVRYEKEGIGATGAGDGALNLTFTAEEPGPVRP